MSIQKEWLDFLREQFVEAKSAPRETPCGHSTLRSLASPLPTETAARVSTGAPFGSRIKVRTLGEGAPDALKPGATGSLEHIDGNGVFHVAWDSGETLPLVIGQDSFSVSPPPLQTLKLYMPMTATYYDEEDPEEDITIDPHEAARYAPYIINALQSERRWIEDYGYNHNTEEVERGLMAYFNGPGSVDQKVQSYWFTAEVRDGRLWGVAECSVRGELAPLELQYLINNIGGQASDGNAQCLKM